MTRFVVNVMKQVAAHWIIHHTFPLSLRRFLIDLKGYPIWWGESIWPSPSHWGQEILMTNSIINTQPFLVQYIILLPPSRLLSITEVFKVTRAEIRRHAVGDGCQNGAIWGFSALFYSLAHSYTVIVSLPLQLMYSTCLSLFAFPLRATIISGESHGLKIPGYWSVRHLDE